MSGRKSRDKGARGERELCGMLRDNLGGDWKQIANWPSYWVSDSGQVWSVKAGRLLRGLVSRDGYRKIHLSDSGSCQQRFVHRLVAEAFVEGSGEQVRHINGQKQDNRAVNLAWGTCQENIMDKWTHGTMPHGDGHHASKIPESEIPLIRSSKESSARIAERYGVSRTAIYLIKKGRNYGWC